MKNILAIFLPIYLSISAFTQPVVKGWVYQQDSLSGTKSTAQNENGKVVKKDAGINYLIFISHNKTSNVVPLEIYLKGTQYKVGMIQIKKTPVEIVNHNLPSNPVKTELVPLTSNKVLSLKRGPEISTNVSDAPLKKLIASNDAVIAYLWKGKKYFVAVKEIIRLEPVMNE